MMDQQDLKGLARLGHAFQVLKRVPRTGWLLRGVAPGEVESVAAHTCGVGLIALTLAGQVGQPLDQGRLLAICLLHDLAEAVTSDWPRPVSRYLPDGAKHDAERQALVDLLSGLPLAADWLTLWDEFGAGQTVESRLARDADKLDLMLQAWAYEQSGRNGLEEFWQDAARFDWEFAASAALFQRLVEERDGWAAR